MMNTSKAVIGIVAVAALVLGAASIAQATIIEHIGSNDPLGEGWFLHDTGDPGDHTTYTTPADTEAYWGIQQAAGKLARYRYALTQAQVDDSSGWTVTGRGKAIASDEPFNAVLEVWDNRDVWRLGLCDGTSTYSKGLYVLDAAGTYTQVSDTIDPTAAYHTYQIVFDPKLAGTADDLATYYVDGQVVTTQTRAQARNYSYLYVDFADTGGGGASDSRWSLVRFELGQHPIPEPSSLVLVGTGAIGLIGWGWRRRRR